MGIPEIMAPAGSFETLAAAIKAGADSVYFGVGSLNMRARSAKFDVDDLELIAKTCKDNNVNSYLTLNTVMYDEDLEHSRELCDRAKTAGVTAIIACDMAVIQYANSIGLPVHMSTQANISNIEAVKFYAKYAEVIVLARELSLDQIKDICTKIKDQDIKGPGGNLVEVEVFIHGALCVSISGKCYMSLAQYNHSANRGDCLQTCRRSYIVTDDETGEQLKVENRYIMSPKDLCTISIIDKLVDAGISVFKIEGRARGPEYVATVTRVYKEAVDAVADKTFSEEKAESWRKELASVFNRGFWENGYYLGKQLGEWAGDYGSQATDEKVQVGKVIHYFDNKQIAEIHVDSEDFRVGDRLLFTGPTTGAVFIKVESIMSEDQPTGCGMKGHSVTVPVKEKVRVNDKVFIIRPRS